MTRTVVITSHSLLGAVSKLYLIKKNGCNNFNYLLLPYSPLRADNICDYYGEKHPSWINIPMFFFILFSFVPYGMGLNYQYQQLNPALKNASVSCSSVSMPFLFNLFPSVVSKMHKINETFFGYVDIFQKLLVAE